MRPPRVADGRNLWQLARTSQVLDVNSPYLYLLIGAHFADTSIVAQAAKELVGFVSGYRPPNLPETLFVWQVAVADSARGRGIARGMLMGLLHRPACAGVRFIETTVTPSNQPSRAMFDSLARRLGTTIAESPGFPSHLFPDANHDEERLLRIGPFEGGQT